MALAGRFFPWECIGVPADCYRAGSFKKPLFAQDDTRCVGIETIDGTRYYADKVVLAAGAWSPALVDLEDQCVSKVSGQMLLAHF